MVLVDRLHPLRLLRLVHLLRPPGLVDLLGLDHRAGLLDRLHPLRLLHLPDLVGLLGRLDLLDLPGLVNRLMVSCRVGRPHR